MDDVETIASVIEGEAGGEGEAGMRAVANVIANRARENFGGHGGLVGQALAPNQFQARRRPSAAALAIAAGLAAGQLLDTTGGATFYANPLAASEPWARRLNDNNAYRIGRHYFTSNVEGRPFHGPYDDQIARHAAPAATPQPAPPVAIAKRPAQPARPATVVAAAPPYDDQIARHSTPATVPSVRIAAKLPAGTAHVAPSQPATVAVVERKPALAGGSSAHVAAPQRSASTARPGRPHVTGSPSVGGISAAAAIKPLAAFPEALPASPATGSDSDSIATGPATGLALNFAQRLAVTVRSRG